MKKIIILAVALLSTGIVFATTALTKHNDEKTAIVKVDATATTGHTVANDAVASAD
ncbi:hypothetical protein [Mucilaginibacter sp. PPCGB 2223]|uniref:hypothetical protein n=1 Tax=Mucilaginibacter sp. PPCGB 2223 TaxID=1886027 RepID=UPI001585E4E2|nr:hypothetical protein [Mucilaginibacter sp. PPCGB 2223]